jgi:hypothetical protein
MLRFTIRDVLWLTVVVALGRGWWVSYRTAWAENRRLAEWGKEQERYGLVAERCMLDMDDESGVRFLKE